MRSTSPRMMFRRAWRVGAAVSLAAGALIAVATPAAPAAQFTVLNTNDAGVGSLRQAVLDANANAGPDEIIFDPSIDTQMITLTSGSLSVTGELTVTGNGATNTIVDGNLTDRIFLVSGLVPFTISGATLQNGVSPSGDGGAIDSDGAVTVDATTISDNSTSGNGGGVDAADVTIRNGSAVRANKAGNNGGGALAESGDATVTDSTIGGSSVADANTAGSEIGGVGVPLTPGGLGTATITNSTVSHNTAPNGGGVGGPAVVVSGCTISSNDDAGIASLGALTITDSLVSSNASNGGGGARSEGGSVTITGSWFDQNTATFAGGGLVSVGPGTTVISDSTFSNNRQTDSAGFGGGAIGLADVNATLTNVTVSGNSADGTGGGGGILVLTLGGTPSPDTVTIGSSTIEGNAGGGIAVAANAAATTVGSTILSNNTVGPGCDGSITDSGFNLLFNTTAGSCVFDAANDVTGADPALDALTLNAPATLVPTMALSAGSPALDAVTTGCPPPATDARGVTRPQSGACDIGAFELAVVPPPPTTTTATTPTVGPTTGESVGSGATGTLPATGGPGPGLALVGVALLALGAILELAPRARGRGIARVSR